MRIKISSLSGSFPYIYIYLILTERFSVPVLKTQPEDPGKIQSGSSLTLLCTNEIFSNDTTVLYSFFNGEKELVRNGTNGTHVIGQASTNNIGNYTCQSKWNTLMKRSNTVLINGKQCYISNTYVVTLLQEINES